jgi:hypothetical protein
LKVLPALLALAVISLPTGEARAQSVEESYAGLCKTDEQKQGETCLTLRKAVLDKLHAEMPAVADASPTPVAESTELVSDSSAASDRSAGDNVPTLPVGKPLVAQAGVGDAKGPQGMRMACYRLPLEPNHAYRIKVSVNDAISGAYIADGCQYSANILKAYEGHARNDKEIVFKTKAEPDQGRFLRVNLFGRGKMYTATLEVLASTPGELAAFDAEMSRAREARLLARQQAQAQRSSGGGGGLLGALGGAMLGAMAGGNTEQVVGAAMKGAAMVDPNLSALDSVGNEMIGGTGAAGGVGGLGALGGSAGGSYPTRPNALGGSAACSMMNQGNYRDVSLSGGNDVQLKTMCGQAFEYYSMYLRAIEQGYSEADANRTYDAHQQAALNAISFYENNR